MCHVAAKNDKHTTHMIQVEIHASHRRTWSRPPQTVSMLIARCFGIVALLCSLSRSTTLLIPRVMKRRRGNRVWWQVYSRQHLPVPSAGCRSQVQLCYTPLQSQHYVTAFPRSLSRKVIHSAHSSFSHDNSLFSFSSCLHPSPSIPIHHSAIYTRNITASIMFYSLLGYQTIAQFRTGPARAAWLEPIMLCQSSSNSGSASRIEFIEVPEYMQDPKDTRVSDLLLQPTYIGYHHIALDVTDQVTMHHLHPLSSHQSNHANVSVDALSIPPTAPATTTITAAATSSISNSTAAAALISPLQLWLNRLNDTSVATFGKTIRLAIPPRSLWVGNGHLSGVYEIAFIYDNIGCLLELIHKQGEIFTSIDTNEKYPDNKNLNSISSGWEPLDVQDFQF
jgi:hypothetical protein